MYICVDSREQLPYCFSKNNVQVVRTTLQTGDYSLPGFEDRIAIERKNGVDELVACLCRDRKRFEAELARARGFDFFAVVIEGNFADIVAGKYRSQMTPNAVVASIAAFTNRYGVPFLFCGNRDAAELLTYQLLSKFTYEIQRAYALVGNQGAVVETSKNGLRKK